MITLYGFGGLFGSEEGSPFVAKVMTFLKIADVEFEMKRGAKYLKHAPKGKLPYLTDGANSIGESDIIIDYICQQYHIDLDQHLTVEQCGQSYLLRKAIDGQLCDLLVYSRWIDEPSFQAMKQQLTRKMPIPIKYIAPIVVRKKVHKRMANIGLFDFSSEQIHELLDKNLSALSQVLSDKTYFFGDQPSLLDAVAYGTLSQFMLSELDNSYNQRAKLHTNLVLYCQRLRLQLFSE